MSLSWGSPIIFAHRGASAYAPENTLAAFEIAIQQEADVIELDTKLSADGRVVVIHDQTLDRTTDGSGRVGDYTLASLQKLDAGSHFSNQYRSEKIPTLEQVIELCVGRILINVELSNYSTPFDDLPIKVAALIYQIDRVSDILVSSFHPIPLLRFHNLLPEIPIGFLARRGVSGVISRSWIGKYLIPYKSLHIDKSDVTPTLIEKTQNAEKKFYTFTVNSQQEINHLLSLNIDGIMTDDPLIAHQAIVETTSE